MRVFRYTRYWEDMSDFTTALFDSIIAILSLLLLLIIFLIILALLGMQIFGGRMNFDEGRPRSHFDDFWTAFLTVFQVITGENWNTVMYDTIRSYGGLEGGQGVIGVIFICGTFILGNFVLLNVFLAIAVKSLDDAKAAKEKRDAFIEKWCRTHEEHSSWESERYGNPLLNQPKQRRRTFLYDPDGPVDLFASPTIDTEEKEEKVVMNEYVSLWLFSPDNGFRQSLFSIVYNQTFENFILLCIVASSLLLAAEDPVNEDAEINGRLLIADYFFTAIFTLEMIGKIISLGLIFHRGAYLRDGWNVLDALVVTASIMTIALSVSISHRGLPS